MFELGIGNVLAWAKVLKELRQRVADRLRNDRERQMGIDESHLIMFLIGVPVGALIGALIGQSRGRTGAGAVLGLLLGPIGWLAVALGPNLKPKCPLCGGVIIQGAQRCKNCGGDIINKQTHPISYPSSRPPNTGPQKQYRITYHRRTRGITRNAAISQKEAHE